MKRMTILIGLCLAFALPFVANGQQVTLLHVNDSHSHIDAWGPRDASLEGTLGGLPKAASIVLALKAANPNALFVHAGDFSNGDLFFNESLGSPELQMLQSLGLDAIILGNRDFQLGPDILEHAIADAWPAGGGVPVLGANVQPNGHAIGDWLQPTLMKNVNGVEVGLFGLSLPNGPLAQTGDVRILPYLPTPGVAGIAQDTVDALRAAGAKLIICVGHLGMSKSVELAEQVSGIDVIVNAHDNAYLEQPQPVTDPNGGTTLIVSAGHYYEAVGKLQLAWENGAVRLVDYALLKADAKTPRQPDLQMVVDDLKAQIVARYGDVFNTEIAFADKKITPAIDPLDERRDSALGDLITDAYRSATATDIAVEVTSLLDDSIDRGPVAKVDLFRSMSFGFTVLPGPENPEFVRPLRLVTFNATGEALTMAFNKMIAYGLLPQVSGMRIVCDSTLALPVKQMTVGDEPLVPGQTYSVTANRYAYDALRRSPFKVPMTDMVEWETLAWDAFCAFAASRGVLTPDSGNRIIDEHYSPVD